MKKTFNHIGRYDNSTYEVEFKSKQINLPPTIRFFLSKVTNKFDFLFTKWLVKILCRDLGLQGLTHLPKLDPITLSNLHIIERAYALDTSVPPQVF